MFSCARVIGRAVCPRAFYNVGVKESERERERESQDWVIKILIKASGGILKRGTDNGGLDRGRGP